MPYYDRDPKREHNFDNHPYSTGLRSNRDLADASCGLGRRLGLFGSTERAPRTFRSRGVAANVQRHAATLTGCTLPGDILPKQHMHQLNVPTICRDHVAGQHSPPAAHDLLGVTSWASDICVCDQAVAQVDRVYGLGFKVGSHKPQDKTEPLRNFSAS